MEMVPVRWERPGSRYHCVIHLVSTSLVKGMNDHEVVVMWPCKGKEPESWVGTRVI